MKKKKIVFVDSGAGGLHIMAECIFRMPNYEYIYFADTFNAPFGNKTKKQLKQIASKLVDEIIFQHNPEIIVFACNTLTVNTIEYIREKFPNIKFVGVEPALKTAKINGGNTIIFATKGTIKNYRKLDKKINKQLAKEYKEQNLHYFNDDKIYKISSTNLPQLIDENLNNLDLLIPELSKIFKAEKYQACTNMVIGCTHFLAIKEQLNDIFPNIKFFDGVSSIVNRIYSLTNNSKFKTESQKKYTIITTDGDLQKQEKFEQYFLKLI